MTLVDYTFNYTVFSLLTTGRLTSLWIVLETWVLRDGFRCPLQGASEELFSFCLLTRAQGQAWSGGGTSLLRADSCRDSLGWGLCSPQPAPEPASPREPPSSGDCQCLQVPAPSFSLTGWLISWSFTSQKTRKHLGSCGLGVEFEQWWSNAEKWQVGTWGRGGWEAPWAGRAEVCALLYLPLFLS